MKKLIIIITTIVACVFIFNACDKASYEPDDGTTLVSFIVDDLTGDWYPSYASGAGFTPSDEAKEVIYSAYPKYFWIKLTNLSTGEETICQSNKTIRLPEGEYSIEHYQGEDKNKIWCYNGDAEPGKEWGNWENGIDNPDNASFNLEPFFKYPFYTDCYPHKVSISGKKAEIEWYVKCECNAILFDNTLYNTPTVVKRIGFDYDAGHSIFEETSIQYPVYSYGNKKYSVFFLRTQNYTYESYHFYKITSKDINAQVKEQISYIEHLDEYHRCQLLRIF